MALAVFIFAMVAVQAFFLATRFFLHELAPLEKLSILGVLSFFVVIVVWPDENFVLTIFGSGTLFSYQVAIHQIIKYIMRPVPTNNIGADHFPKDASDP